MDVRFPPGRSPAWPGPLQRFLPPLEEGTVTSALNDLSAVGDLVFDPFGASPRLVREAAAAGRRVLVAANNPVTRFVLQHTLDPLSLPDLQSALARIASAPKNDSRMEPFLLDLYRTTCSRCGEIVAADMLIWDRAEGMPVLKIYACAECGNAVQEATSAADQELALSFEGKGLHYALALQRVVPVQDPDRRHAEAALEIYTGRAIYALTTLLNKLDQLRLTGVQQNAVHALLLSAFDMSNALWDYPEGRARPRQLRHSAQYREMNVWRALERAVAEWAMPGPGIECSAWEEGELPREGTVALFAGPVRELAPRMSRDSVQHMVTVLPRPNQAFWTLSALWASWIWGRDIAAPIQAALRRRRYDWSWHATALRAALNHVRPVMEGGAHATSLIAEAEPGFVAASLAGFDKAGFAIAGRALRLDAAQALFRWTAASSVTLPVEEGVVAQRIEAAMMELLRQRGEPTPFPLLHAAVWSDLAQRRLLSASWQKVGSPPLMVVGSEIEAALENQGAFTRLDRWAEVESGTYWMAKPEPEIDPLADRVEQLVLERLREAGRISMHQLEGHITEMLQGLLTPDRDLVIACLQSYATEVGEDDAWSLDEHEAQDARRGDCAGIVDLLIGLGKRLGFKVQGEDTVQWSLADGKPVYRFRVQETAAMGAILQDEGDPAITLVLPGGRAELVAEKTRRDARIRMWLEAGNCIVKFRHVRRLDEDPQLRRENFAECLNLDPAEQQDPQMHLL